jgi:thiol:disulfide interchange protein
VTVLTPRTLVIVLSVTFLFGTVACNRSEIAPPPADTVAAHGAVKVTWGEDLPTALDRARSEGKPVLVNFYADWCVWCQRLESTTFRDAEVANLLQQRVVPVSLDVDHEGRELSSRYRVDGLPTILLLDADGREIGRLPGYMPPTGFLEWLEAAIGDTNTV